MTQIPVQLQSAFQEFTDSMEIAQKNLKKGLHKVVRDSAVDAEQKLTAKEKLELKKIEENLFVTKSSEKITEKKRKSRIFSFWRKS